MKVIIIEDEKAAVRNLKALLQEVKPEVEVEAVLDSIAAVLDWFAVHSMPDMLFMDIHLADGSAFEIFDHVDITCPIVFTTAYDEYALRAFKVNSVDYLLKPIGKSDIEKAFHKLEQLHGSEQGKSPDNALLQLIHSLKKQESYKTHFLIPAKGDKLLPVSVDMTECIDPSLFFRVNRQFLISREAIKDIDLWFNNRLSINLRCKVSDEKVLVSKARVQEFKDWFSKTH